jgi:hypothetical protein
MYVLIYEIKKFLFTLRLRIKLMSEKDFKDLIEKLDNEQKVYALIFRYL